MRILYITQSMNAIKIYMKRTKCTGAWLKTRRPSGKIPDKRIGEPCGVSCKRKAAFWEQDLTVFSVAMAALLRCMERVKILIYDSVGYGSNRSRGKAGLPWRDGSRTGEKDKEILRDQRRWEYPAKEEN